MANGRGGARPGAGRKRKSLAEKQLNGNPGHALLKKLKEPEISSIEGEEMPPVAEYLKKATKNANENIAPEIYGKTWNGSKNGTATNS